MLNLKSEVTFDNIDDVTNILIILSDILSFNTSMFSTFEFYKSFVSSNALNKSPSLHNIPSVHYQHAIKYDANVIQASVTNILNIPNIHLMDHLVSKIDEIIDNGKKLCAEYIDSDDELDVDIDAFANAMKQAKVVSDKYKITRKYIEENWSDNNGKEPK